MFVWVNKSAVSGKIHYFLHARLHVTGILVLICEWLGRDIVFFTRRAEHRIFSSCKCSQYRWLYNKHYRAYLALTSVCLSSCSIRQIEMLPLTFQSKQIYCGIIKYSLSLVSRSWLHAIPLQSSKTKRRC